MRRKGAVLRALANTDIRDVLVHYGTEGGTPLALAFLDALEDAIRRVERHPASGSPRYESELGIPRLRSVALQGFPYLVFYREEADHLDVWRVLHAHRDLPGSLADPPA